LTVISELYEQVLKNQDATATSLKNKLESLNSHLHFDALTRDQLSTLERSFVAHQGDLSIAVGKLVEHESTVKQTLALFCKMLAKAPGLDSRWVTLASRNMKEDYRLFEGSVEEAKEDLLTLTRTILSFNQYKNELQKAEMQRQKMALTARAEEANLALQHSNFAVAQTNLAVQRAILLLAVPVTAASALQIGIADTPDNKLTIGTKVIITAVSLVVSSVIAAVSYLKASRALKEQLDSIAHLEAQILEDSKD
jgi:ABC-type multidrug transport system fused ATPase/permease subunit